MIYLASPYSHPSVTVVEQRFEAACAAVAELCRKGYVPYSPIVHFHPVSIRHRLNGSFAFWRDINFAMLARADNLHVLMIDGWEDSIGVIAEIKHAEGLGKLVYYMDPVNG